MKLNRSIGLMLASTAFASIASGAFALDGNDIIAKINALSSKSGVVIAAEGTSVDGDNVTLTGVTATVSSADNKKVPLGDVKLEGVSEDEDGYVWIRRFEDEADRVARYAATYDDPEWTGTIAPTVRDLLLTDRSVVTRVRPTPVSVLR